MQWFNACKVFDEKVFEDYNLFCIFIKSIDTIVECNDSDSIINEFAKWIDGRVEFPSIKNTCLSEMLQSKYADVYKSRYIEYLRDCLDDFKDCFQGDSSRKQWGIYNSETVVSENSSNMFEEMKKLGEGLSDAQRFYK